MLYSHFCSRDTFTCVLFDLLCKFAFPGTFDSHQAKLCFGFLGVFVCYINLAHSCSFGCVLRGVNRATYCKV